MKKKRAVSSKVSAVDKIASRLRAHRARVDAADRALLAALGVRFKAVARIGKLKIAHGMPLLQTNRWEEVMKECVKRGARLGLAPPFVTALYELIHVEALKTQEILRRKK